MRFAISSGIGPLKWLTGKNKDWRFAKFPISLGMLPVKLFLDKCRELRFVRFPTELGISPAIPVLVKFIDINEVILLISSG